ncbi:MAG TPA: BglII/BstYI family type II restriction endonuclease [Ochrobactrum sp.]|nr:BglII/BstYI family type II restriction endonuclease [Ochrobactrum sp.]
MRYSIFSYRYAREILEHHTNANAFNEIVTIVSQAPLFIYPNKSSKNAKLDVVQQCMNTWFDRAFAVDRGWLYHPLATAIQNSRLAADFRKTFPNITVQAEVQLGNMSRWYSDIFKLQTAYSQSLVNLGLSIVPMGNLGKRIDSNIVSYERVVRELPSADLSITLPILVIGIEPDEDTQVVDLRQPQIPLLQLTQRGSEKNRYRVVHALTNGTDLHNVTSVSDTGPMANPIVDPAHEDEG